MNNIKILTTLLVLASSISLYGRNIKNDSIPTLEELSSIGFSRNVDSLMHLWYVKQSVENDTLQSNFAFLDDTVDYSASVKLPDSVYINRLARIPSVIDLSYNSIVKSHIGVYTNKRKRNLEVMLGLSEYYFPMFEEALDKYDLPLELKYMAVIESALNAKARSRVGATGLWQFMYSTGRMYNLTINSHVDQRMDPLAATDAACRFLKDLHDMFGDWTLAIAAYNCGPGNVNKAIRRTGKRSYWDIYYYLPRETRGYVPAFIAASYAMNYYSEYDMTPREIEMPINIDTIMLSKDYHLQQVANVLEIPINQLKDMNPQYRYEVIPGSSKPYAIIIPSHKSLQFIDLQDSIYNFNREKYFGSGKVEPLKYSSSKYTPSTPKNKAKIYYTVKSGDAVGLIADWYDIRTSDLRYWNNINRNLIKVGQKLIVFVPKNKESYYSKINSMSSSQRRKLSGSTASTTTAPSKTTFTGEYKTYTVKSGDSLWKISTKFTGISDEDIRRANGMSNNKISPGQELKIPIVK